MLNVRTSPAPLRPVVAAPPLQGRRRPRTAAAGACKDKVAALPQIDSVSEVVITLPDGTSWSVPNKPGKAASARIFSHLAAAHGGRLTLAAAEEALSLYEEFTDEAKAKPGSHPNIDLCFRVIAERLELPIHVKVTTE